MFPGLLPIFLHSCAIKSGSGLGMRLHSFPPTFTCSYIHTLPQSHPPTLTPSYTTTDTLSQSSLPSEGSVEVKKKGRFNLETFPLCDPRHFLHRYSLLILMCFLSFGNYFVYDNPASLPKVLKRVSRICVSVPGVLEPDVRVGNETGVVLYRPKTRLETRWWSCTCMYLFLHEL